MAAKGNVFKEGTAAYYKYGPILSRNAAINIVIGPRGDGKTYGAKEHAIKKAIEKGEEFILLRRYKTELNTRTSFFTDIAANMLSRYPGHEFRVNGLEAQMKRPGKDKWETIGYFVALSNSQQKKSVSYKKVTTIIFDEFIIDKGALHYLPNEVKALLDFYNTVDRWEDRVRVFMISNTVSIMNPYFIQWDIKPHKNAEWIVKGDGFVCVHLIRDHEFAQQVRETRVGKFIENTDYAEYAIGGVFLDNHQELVAKKSSDAKYYATIESETGIFAWWIDRITGMHYVTEKRPKQEWIWTMCADKMSADKVYMLPNDKSLMVLRAAFSRGRLFFSSAQARNAFVGVMKR